MNDLTLTEVIIACELKWRYRNVDEAQLMQILVISDVTTFAILMMVSPAMLFFRSNQKVTPFS